MSQNLTKQLVRDDISQYKSIEALGNLDGGKLLIKNLGKDVVGSIETLITSYKQASHIELLATVAKLQADLALYRVLKRAGRNKKMAEEELKRLLVDDPEE